MMLAKFEVKNFKNFSEPIIMDFSNTKGYEFNSNLISHGLVKDCVIFGKNGSGKTNLAYALFDIVNHLTDNNKTIKDVYPYRNLDSDVPYVEFKYTFILNGKIVEYEYSKVDPEELVFEKITIENVCYVYYDFIVKKGECLLEGTENLNLSLDNNKLSFVKYINNNSILNDNEVNRVFKEFINFVDNMLLFYSLESNNRYFGFKNGNESIADAIVRNGKLDDFQNFLNRLEIKCDLTQREVDGKFIILNKYENGEANFYSVASTGTRSLMLFYYWLISAKEASLIFMDEFDAYYHFELSEEVVREVISNVECQVIFTSHNTNLIENDIFRPDCLFVLQETAIKSMSELTNKELRKAHNLQKMYKARTFNE